MPFTTPAVTFQSCPATLSREGQHIGFKPSRASSYLIRQLGDMASGCLLQHPKQ